MKAMSLQEAVVAAAVAILITVLVILIAVVVELLCCLQCTSLLNWHTAYCLLAKLFRLVHVLLYCSSNHYISNNATYLEDTAATAC
jgi:hypothetical protein